MWSDVGKSSRKYVGKNLIYLDDKKENGNGIDTKSSCKKTEILLKKHGRLSEKNEKQKGRENEEAVWLVLDGAESVVGWLRKKPGFAQVA